MKDRTRAFELEVTLVAVSCRFARVPSTAPILSKDLRALCDTRLRSFQVIAAFVSSEYTLK